MFELSTERVGKDIFSSEKTESFSLISKDKEGPSFSSSFGEAKSTESFLNDKEYIPQKRRTVIKIIREARKIFLVIDI
jgi:hypothetical protein